MTQQEINEKAEEFEYTNGTYGFKAGVKWQQEQIKDVYLNGYVDGLKDQAKLRYSDEEVRKILWEYIKPQSTSEGILLDDFLEKFKKK